MSAGKTGAWARRKARRALVQALYQWEMTAAGVRQIEDEFADALKKADREFFREALTYAAFHTEELDAHLEPVLDRKLGDLDKVELALLRLGVFELTQRLDVPYRVVIAEYVDLAKTFGAEDSHKYVNAVLDALAKTTRTVETGG